MNPSENISAVNSSLNVIFCEVCELVFDNDACLRKHMPLHRIACLMCMQSFTNRQKLLRHLRVRDKDDTVQCCCCKLRYASISALNSHDCFGMFPYYCGHCLKGFGKLDIYEEHMVLHADMGQYECRFCEEKFPYENGLVRHEKFTHAIEMQQDIEYAGSTYSSDSETEINPHETTFNVATSPNAVDHESGENSNGSQPGKSGLETVRKSSECKSDGSKSQTNTCETEGSSSELIKVILEVPTDGSGLPRYMKYEPKMSRASAKQKKEASNRSRSASKPKTRKSTISIGESTSVEKNSMSGTAVCAPVLDVSTPWTNSAELSIREGKRITNAPLFKTKESNLDTNLNKARVSRSQSTKIRTEAENGKTQIKRRRSDVNKAAVEAKNYLHEKNTTKAKEDEEKSDTAMTKKNETGTKKDITNVKDATQSKSSRTRIKRSLTEPKANTTNKVSTSVMKTELKRNTTKVKDITKVKSDTPMVKRGKTKTKAINNKETALELNGSKLVRNRLRAAGNDPRENILGSKTESLFSGSDGLISSIEKDLPESELNLNTKTTPIKQMEKDATCRKTDISKTKKRMAKSDKGEAKFTNESTVSTRNTPKTTRETAKITKEDITKMKQDITKTKKENKTESPKNISKAEENTIKAKKGSTKSKKNPTMTKKGKAETDWELKLSEGEEN